MNFIRKRSALILILTLLISPFSFSEEPAKVKTLSAKEIHYNCSYLPFQHSHFGRRFFKKSSEELKKTKASIITSREQLKNFIESNKDKLKKRQLKACLSGDKKLSAANDMIDKQIEKSEAREKNRIEASNRRSELVQKAMEAAAAKRKEGLAKKEEKSKGEKEQKEPNVDSPVGSESGASSGAK